MHTLFKFLTCLSLTLSLVSFAFAQNTTPANGQRAALTVTASASSDRVRFTAPSAVQIRLEVYNRAGKKLFDNEVRGGNVLDWSLQDGQGERLADDTYLCIIAVKSLSGRITERVGSVVVKRGAASVRAADVSQMTAQQSDAVGPIEENQSLSILKEDEPQTPTVIAHNGEDGLVTRGRGALSFRIGDFFRGNDSEQMRLTAEGNLGIGITHPQARLEVDGLIRTTRGIVFPDGSVQTTAAIVRNAGEIADSTRLGQSDDQIGISGKGGKQKKKVSPEFNVNEDLTINGNIIFTPPSPHFTRDITMQNNNGGLRFFGAPTLTNSPAAAAIQFWGNNSPFPGQLYLDSGAHDSGAVIIRTTGTGGTITERMRVTASGNVGIGTGAGVLTSKVEIAAQDGLAITGFQPFMTLRDTNTGGLRSILAGGNGDFGFYPNSFIGGGPAVLIKNVTGNVGIGVSNPTARLQVDAGNTAGIQANSQGNAIVGYSSTTGFAAIYGENTSGSSGFGVYGKGAVGVRGEGGAGSSQGVYGSGFYGVFGSTSNVNGAGVYGESTVGSAGFFAGDVTITGSLYGVQDGFFDGTVYAEEFISRNGFFDGTVHAGDFIERSDRNVKANFANVDTRDILQRLAAIPIQTWNFKSQPESVRHLGPMAQDFRAAFNLGYDDKHIGTIDADGVALAAIQALYQLVQEKDKQIEHLQARVARLERTAKKRSIGPRPASR